MIAVVLTMQDGVRPDVWTRELEEVLLRVGHRFGRADLRRRMRAYVQGLAERLGEDGGVLVIDETGFLKKGRLGGRDAVACPVFRR